MPVCHFTQVTASRPGAIGLIQLDGEVEPLLYALTGRKEWTTGRVRLAPLGDVDEGIVALIAPDLAQLMPHGGPRVMQRLRDMLIEAGAVGVEAGALPPRRLFPEAADDVEALMLCALARAASPLAIDLLLDQPRRWREAPTLTDADLARSSRLDRLIDPPTVVVAGPPNVGKSTLSNALLGRDMSIALDARGTTRDYTVGRIDLGGFVVWWHDTPGLRDTSDAVETQAIALASQLLARADCIVAITDGTDDWPRLPRPADLRIASRSDMAPRSDGDLSVSATTGSGLDVLVQIVRDRLVPAADLSHPGPWLFDDRLNGAAAPADPVG